MLYLEISKMEKEAWLELLATIGVLVFYINGMLGLDGVFATHPESLGSLAIQTIAISIVFTIIISLFFGIGKEVINFCFGFEDQKVATKIDERDKLIELKAMRWAYYVFNIGCFMIVGKALFTEALSSLDEDRFALVFGLFPNFDFIIHSIIILIIIAHIVQNSVEIYLHRKGF